MNKEFLKDLVKDIPDHDKWFEYLCDIKCNNCKLCFIIAKQNWKYNAICGECYDKNYVSILK